ncbi:PrsW family glutamic-type intramembrane protease [Cryptosporangium sp. NPDC048952]|uniref:PrsW family glutamic-type intramembrane protease n=1 Tax=Cryptosporangium sp. NPDC048952 TaxID=3363961 RepID=UPI003723F667
MQWRRDLWLAVLAIGTAAFVVGERILAASGEPGLVTPVLVIGVVTAPTAFYAACRGMHLTLPTWAVVASAVVGAVLGSVLSGLLGYSALVSLGPVATVAVSLVVESVILLVPLAVLATRLLGRRASDGLLVGAAAGAGFAVAQTLGYLLTSGDHSVLVRGLLAPASQLAWSGIAASALWLAAQEHWNARALRRLVLAVSGVVALHALWESVHGVPARVVLTALNALLLGWVTLRTTSRRGVPTRVLPRPAVAPRPAGTRHPDPADAPRTAASAGPRTASPAGAAPAGAPRPANTSTAGATAARAAGTGATGAGATATRTAGASPAGAGAARATGEGTAGAGAAGATAAGAAGASTAGADAPFVVGADGGQDVALVVEAGTQAAGVAAEGAAPKAPAARSAEDGDGPAAASSVAAESDAEVATAEGVEPAEVRERAAEEARAASANILGPAQGA